MPTAVLADRFSRPKIIVIDITLWSLATAACGMAGNFLYMFMARLGVGIGEAAFSPAVCFMGCFGDCGATHQARLTEHEGIEDLARCKSVWLLKVKLGTDPNAPHEALKLKFVAHSVDRTNRVLSGAGMLQFAAQVADVAVHCSVGDYPMIEVQPV